MRYFLLLSSGARGDAKSIFKAKFSEANFAVCVPVNLLEPRLILSPVFVGAAPELAGGGGDFPALNKFNHGCPRNAERTAAAVFAAQSYAGSSPCSTK
jgi:hypothetical protein